MMQCGDQNDVAVTALTLTARQCQVPAEHSSECLSAWAVMQSAGVGVVDPLQVPGQTWKVAHPSTMPNAEGLEEIVNNLW
jgi:hypothetical protein